MTSSVVHLSRLARWGVTLARRRALVGIENDPNAPAALRRLVRLARLATLTGKRGKPDYAGAFRATERWMPESRIEDRMASTR